MRDFHEFLEAITSVDSNGVKLFKPNFRQDKPKCKECDRLLSPEEIATYGNSCVYCRNMPFSRDDDDQPNLWHFRNAPEVGDDEEERTKQYYGRPSLQMLKTGNKRMQKIPQIY